MLFDYFQIDIVTNNVNGFLSDPCAVISGVPQGSVFSPLLFLILLIDIDKKITSSFLSSFADDTRVGKSIQTAEDANYLQQDLYAIFKWAKDTNMEFNSDKFECLRYQANPSQPIPPHVYLTD